MCPEILQQWRLPVTCLLQSGWKGGYKRIVISLIQVGYVKLRFVELVHMLILCLRPTDTGKRQLSDSCGLCGTTARPVAVSVTLPLAYIHYIIILL